jgi:hypothetical protein
MNLSIRHFAQLLAVVSILCACGSSSNSGNPSSHPDASVSGSSTGSGSSGDSGPGDGSGSSSGSGSSGSSGSGGQSGSTGSSGSAGAVEGGAPDGGASGSAGCGKTSTMTFGAVPNENPNAAAGSGSGVGHGKGGWVTIQSSGQTRGFAMRLPDNYDMNHPYSLIFGFHWNGGTADQVDNGGSNGYWWAYWGLQRESKNGAIFVAPQGLNNAWANSNGQDLTFTDDMVNLIEQNYCVDTTHITASGFSYGGGMSYAIACARAKVFHAVVLYEAGVLSGCQGGNDPIAYMQIHGLTDTTLSVSGAAPMRDKFVKNNGCTPNANPPAPAQPSPYLNPGGHICTNYAGCSSGHPLRWCVHQSGHGPGPIDGTSDLYNSCATAPKMCSTTCPCTWTSADVWSWLTDPSTVGATMNATQ